MIFLNDLHSLILKPSLQKQSDCYKNWNTATEVPSLQPFNPIPQGTGDLCLVSGSAAPEPHGKLPEMQILRPHPRLARTQWGPVICVFKSLFGDCDTLSKLRAISRLGQLFGRQVKKNIAAEMNNSNGLLPVTPCTLGWGWQPFESTVTSLLGLSDNHHSLEWKGKEEWSRNLKKKSKEMAEKECK